MQTNPQIPARRPGPALIIKKIRISHPPNFFVPASHREKIKENQKVGKCLDLARQMKRLLNINLQRIPLLAGVPGMVLKSLFQIL